MNSNYPSNQSNEMQEQIDAMKSIVESMKTMVDSMKTMVDIVNKSVSIIPDLVKTAVASEEPGNTVTKRKRISSKSALGSSSCRSEEEHEAEQRMIKNCISKAIQYYQTNDIALGNHNNLNSLGMRTIPDPKAYNVEHVKKVTEDYSRVSFTELTMEPSTEI